MLLKSFPSRKTQSVQQLDSYLASLFIFPGILPTEPENSRLKWRKIAFKVCIFLGILGAILCFVLSSTPAHSERAYYLADFGAAVGDAHDYAWLMGGIYMLAGSSSALVSYRHYFSGRRKWTEFFHILYDTSKACPDNFATPQGKEFCRLELLRESVFLTLKYGIVSSFLSGCLYECLVIGAFATFMPYSYTFTWGLNHMIHGFFVVYFTTANTLIAQVLKAEICMYLIWEMNKFVKTLRIFSLEQSSDESLSITLISQYVMHRKRIFDQNEYWKFFGGYVYILAFIGLTFNLYLQFFVQIDLTIRLGIVFWGTGAFLVIIVLQTLMANHLRNSIRDLYPIFTKIFIKTHSIELKLKIESVIGDCTWINPFTCLDFFPLNSHILLFLLIELSMQLLLLVAISENKQ